FRFIVFLLFAAAPTVTSTRPFVCERIRSFRPGSSDARPTRNHPPSHLNLYARFESAALQTVTHGCPAPSTHRCKTPGQLQRQSRCALTRPKLAGDDSDAG